MWGVLMAAMMAGGLGGEPGAPQPTPAQVPDVAPAGDVGSESSSVGGSAARPDGGTTAGAAERKEAGREEAGVGDNAAGRVIARVVDGVGGENGGVGQAELRGEIWVWGEMRTGAALPVGYPAPTPPGAVEVKAYPGVRRAEAEGEAWLLGNGQGGAFWQLFRHISEREIAMTAPVEMDYAERAEDGSWPDLREFTMSFLYREAEMGPVGVDARGVRVVDAEPVTVLAMGMRGDPSRAEFEAAFAELEKVAAGLEGWRVGDRRRSFGYNGPEQRQSLRWWEAQVELVREEGK